MLDALPLNGQGAIAGLSKVDARDLDISHRKACNFDRSATKWGCPCCHSEVRYVKPSKRTNMLLRDAHFRTHEDHKSYCKYNYDQLIRKDSHFYRSGKNCKFDINFPMGAARGVDYDQDINVSRAYVNAAAKHKSFGTLKEFINAFESHFEGVTDDAADELIACYLGKEIPCRDLMVSSDRYHVLVKCALTKDKYDWAGNKTLSPPVLAVVKIDSYGSSDRGKRQLYCTPQYIILENGTIVCVEPIVTLSDNLDRELPQKGAVLLLGTRPFLANKNILDDITDEKFVDRTIQIHLYVASSEQAIYIKPEYWRSSRIQHAYINQPELALA